METLKVRLEALLWFVLFYIVTALVGLVSPITMLVAFIAIVFGKGNFKQWGINCYEGLDNYRSAQTGGDPDDTVSSRLGKARNKGNKVLGYLANKVDLVAEELFNDLNHSAKSIERDEGRKQVTKY